MTHIHLTLGGSTAHGTETSPSKLLSLSTCTSCETRSPVSPQIPFVALLSSFSAGPLHYSYPFGPPTCPTSRNQTWARQRNRPRSWSFGLQMLPLSDDTPESIQVPPLLNFGPPSFKSSSISTLFSNNPVSYAEIFSSQIRISLHSCSRGSSHQCLLSLQCGLGALPGQVRTVVPVPRGDHLPLRAARSSLLCVSLEVLTTPTGRYHGRTCYLALPLPRVQPRCKKVFAHTQVRDPSGSVAACLGPALGDAITKEDLELSSICDSSAPWFAPPLDRTKPTQTEVEQNSPIQDHIRGHFTQR